MSILNADQVKRCEFTVMLTTPEWYSLIPKIYELLDDKEIWDQHGVAKFLDKYYSGLFREQEITIASKGKILTLEMAEDILLKTLAKLAEDAIYEVLYEVYSVQIKDVSWEDYVVDFMMDDRYGVLYRNNSTIGYVDLTQVTPIKGNLIQKYSIETKQ